MSATQKTKQIPANAFMSKVDPVWFWFDPSDDANFVIFFIFIFLRFLISELTRLMIEYEYFFFCRYTVFLVIF